MSNTVRSWAELNKAILATGSARCARGWYAMRYADQEGKGWLPRREALKALSVHLGVSRKSGQLLLDAGMGVWWNWNSFTDVINLEGQHRLAEHFNISALGLAVELPIERLRSLKDFRAALFASWLTREKTISLARAAELFNVSERTISRWSRLAGVEAQRHYGFCKDERDAPTLGHVGTFDVDKDGRPEFLWPLPSIRKSRFTGFPKRQGRGRFSRRSADGHRFFKSAGKLAKHTRGRTGVFYLLSQHRRRWGVFSALVAT